MRKRDTAAWRTGRRGSMSGRRHRASTVGSKSSRRPALASRSHGAPSRVYSAAPQRQDPHGQGAPSGSGNCQNLPWCAGGANVARSRGRHTQIRLLRAAAATLLSYLRKRTSSAAPPSHDSGAQHQSIQQGLSKQGTQLSTGSHHICRHESQTNSEAKHEHGYDSCFDDARTDAFNLRIAMGMTDPPPSRRCRRHPHMDTVCELSLQEALPTEKPNHGDQVCIAPGRPESLTILLLIAKSAGSQVLHIQLLPGRCLMPLEQNAVSDVRLRFASSCCYYRGTKSSRVRHDVAIHAPCRKNTTARRCSSATRGRRKTNFAIHLRRMLEAGGVRVFLDEP